VLQSQRGFAARFNRLLAEAGITPRYHPFHALRHTFASDLLGAGVPMLKVSRWLGHASIQTTVDTYGHLLPRPGRARDGGPARSAWHKRAQCAIREEGGAA
jgi:site-specific recombinase XerD